MTKDLGRVIGKRAALVVSLMMLMACENSNFKKAPVTTTASPKKAMVAVKDDEVVEPTVLPTAEPAPAPAPQNAVIKGSFTAYHVPENPLPFQDYKIFIKIKLPSDKVDGYSQDDLAVTVTGSDGFQDQFPRLVESTPKFQQTFSIDGNEVTLILPIPGGDANVRDTIRCQSKILSENQQLELVFGNTQTP